MEFNVFESIKIGLASPEQIRSWSYGEVKKPETINYRTLKPERDGLFCERIFGPTKDWECHCGKYKRLRYKGKICDRCGVEVTRAKVRRERMGHIELAAPVSHIWYFKGIPTRMGLILDLSPRLLEKVLYFASYIVTESNVSEIEEGQLLNEKEYRDFKEKYGDSFKAGMGAEAIKELLEKIDVEKLSEELKASLENAQSNKRIRILKRLEVVEAFRVSGNRPEWMILDVIPVIPPDIRPMVQLDGGRFATSDLNDLYRRVINRNNRLKKLLELGAPDIIVRNEKRMLQEAVDALIDNGRRGRPVTGPNNRPLKSLSDMLKGKQGRFRQNLLGKRVDYSGRSVIVVGPELKMYQCGLPKEMALELFKPFVMKRLVEKAVATNIKSARKMVERGQNPAVWDSLEVVIKDHPVLLNRAPTLHRLGIQAFEPVLVEGRAIKLHPLVCTAFNADFDGDQMAVHLPLSAEAQAEARFLMLAANNLLKPSDGKPVAIPTQDMILGSYYLTLLNENEPGAGKVFRDYNEAIMAYQDGVVGLHAPIKVRVSKQIGDETITRIIDATVGRLIFNDPIPQDLGYVDRNDPEHCLDLEVSFLVGKKQLGKIVDKCIITHGTSKTSEVLDRIKAQGFKYSTRGAITVAVCDAVIPAEKGAILDAADKKIEKVTKQYRKGLISSEEKSREVVKIWNDATNEVSDSLTKGLDEYNPIFMMANSGARGSINQIRQLAGMRGLIANTSGKTIEIPIKANYREGLNIMEYFISSRGARKGLADTALRTADSGYLTRRLVDVSQDVIIREADCGTTEGIEVYDIMDGKDVIEPLKERLVGRYLLEDAVDEKGNVVVSCDKMIDENDADRVIDILKADYVKELEAKGEDTADINFNGKLRIKIRSIMTCSSKHGVCSKCYGANLANKKTVAIGEAVGVIAAQSIGEPGTQLTMRTFHTGGIANAEDITQGLPRVEELFEARRPKTNAIISEISGTVRIDEIKKNKHVIVADGAEEKDYMIPYGSRIKVHEGDVVEAGDMLTEGAACPVDILAVKGPDAVQQYLIGEVQKTYRVQAVDINDKHIEVIVRQMMRKVKVTESGDTGLISNTLVDKSEVLAANAELQARIDAGEVTLRKAEFEYVLLGITKASLATDSFLSAASFQETTKVLTEAAIKGKTDALIGLKENVIIGKLVPAGTGMDCYNNVEIIPSDPNAKSFLNQKADVEEVAEEAPVEEATETEEAAPEAVAVEE